MPDRLETLLQDSLKPTIKAYKYGYVGRVEVWNTKKGKCLYQHSCGSNRLTPQDALDDAIQLKKDLMEGNKCA